MEELSKKVNKLNQDPEIIDIIIENEDEIIKNTMYEKGISQGISQGINQGITQGIEQKAEETAKKLLEMKMNLKDISKVTGLSIKKIKDIKAGY